MKLSHVCAAVALAAVVPLSSAVADEIQVAVAANFTAPAQELGPMFEKRTGHKVKLSFGATGAFYAQINNGAPYDILLAADSKTPTKMVKEGSGIAGTNFTYAQGTLVFWSSDASKVDEKGELIKTMNFNKCAVADPKLAPYGEAAYQTLEAMGLLEQYKPKFVTGKNINQTMQYAKTGNAEVGFVALSQVFKNGKFTSGSGYVVPAKYYKPIDQDAVLLKHGENSVAAKTFLEFLKSDDANKVKLSYGYAIK